MKAGWKTKPLLSVCDVFTDGDWIESKDQASDGIRLVQTGNVGEGIFKDRAEKARFIDEATFARLNCTEILPGDCLISRLPDPVGRACVVPDTGSRMITAVDCSIVRPKPDQVISEFLIYYTQSRDYLRAVDDVCTGTTRRRISRSNLGKVPVPLPPLEEQRRIVAILDEAFEGLSRARANAEANLQSARELFGSFLASEFSENDSSWHKCPLAEYVKFIDYRGKTPPKTEQGVRLITAKNVKMGFIQRDPEEFILESAYESWMTRGFPKKGDVLFTTEAPLANVAQLDVDETVVIGQRLITMQPNEKVLLPSFLKFSLMSPPIQKEIHARGTGATVLGIKASLLKTVPISFPRDLDEQRNVAARCQEVYDFANQLAEHFEAKVYELNQLRQSLLQKAFAGELTVREFA